MKVRHEQTSGVSGEISPLLLARTDLTKYQSGARIIRNMVVLAEGARTRRPGTRFMFDLGTATQPSAFIPFEGGEGKSFLLSLNDGQMRVFKGGDTPGPVTAPGGAPYVSAVSIPQELYSSLRWAQSMDTMFFALNGHPHRLQRIADNDWQWSLYQYERGPVKVQNVDEARTIQASADTGTITLTASTPTFELPTVSAAGGHVGSIWRLAETNTGDIPVWKIAIAMTVGQKVRWLGRIYEVVTAGDSGDYAPQHEQGDMKAGGSVATAGAVFRFLCFDAGFVRITAVASTTSATAEVMRRLPPAVAATPTYRWNEAAWSEVAGWPSVVAIVDQSLLWGRGNEIWLSETSDIYSFEETTADDSALSLRLFAPDGKAFDFRWAMYAGSLLLGASSGEWVVRGPSNYDRLTPQNARGFLQSAEGSANIQPVTVAGGAVFVGRGKNRLNFAKFDYLNDRIEIQEFTTFSRHMLRGRAKQIAWQGDPHRILWVLLEDGTLSSVTLRPDHEVTGWHRHDLSGAFVEQIACVQSPNNERTEVWLQTRRTIAGVQRRYIELMQPYFEAKNPDVPTAEGAWFLDCAISWEGAPTKELSAAHLAGQVVRVFSDALGDLGQFTASDTGAVVLPVVVTQAIIGLPIQWQTESLPLDVATNSGTSKGYQKQPAGLMLHLHESGPAMISINDARASTVNPARVDSVHAGYPLTSDLVTTEAEPSTSRLMKVLISGESALPFTLLGTLLDMEVQPR